MIQTKKWKENIAKAVYDLATATWKESKRYEKYKYFADSDSKSEDDMNHTNTLYLCIVEQLIINWTAKKRSWEK